MNNTRMLVLLQMPCLAEATSSNDEEDDDESENETHLIPREVLMVRSHPRKSPSGRCSLHSQQQRQRFQRRTSAHREESDEDETVTNVSQVSVTTPPSDDSFTRLSLV